MQAWKRYAAVGAALLLSGCASEQPPRLVLHDDTTAIGIRADNRSGPGHSHPAHIRPNVIQYILEGVRIQSRKSVLPSILTGDAPLVPAFSKDEPSFLASYLGQALADARPHELVSFYRRNSRSSVGLAITSGGLFVHGNHLYLVISNSRTLPSEGMSQSVMSEIDPIENPLLPISRMSFRATFVPGTSVVPEDERWEWPYIDPGRVVVIDLVQIERDLRLQSNISVR